MGKAKIVKELTFSEAFSLLIALRELKTSLLQGQAHQDVSESLHRQDRVPT